MPSVGLLHLELYTCTRQSCSPPRPPRAPPHVSTWTRKALGASRGQEASGHCCGAGSCCSADLEFQLFFRSAQSFRASWSPAAANLPKTSACPCTAAPLRRGPAAVHLRRFFFAASSWRTCCAASSPSSPSLQLARRTLFPVLLSALQTRRSADAPTRSPAHADAPTRPHLHSSTPPRLHACLPVPKTGTPCPAPHPSTASRFSSPPHTRGHRLKHQH